MFITLTVGHLVYSLVSSSLYNTTITSANDPFFEHSQDGKTIHYRSNADYNYYYNIHEVI